MAVHAMLSPQTRRPVSEMRWAGTWQGLSTIIALNFDLTTILLFGAVFQTLLVLALPRLYAVLPAVVVLALRAFDTAAITFGLRRNPYTEGVIQRKTSAVVPDADGEISSECGANESVVVLMLGAKTNHPMNVFAPGFSKMKDFVDRMAKDLDSKAPDNGFLGQTAWFNRDKNGCVQFNLISYWRTIEDIHGFAHDALHFEAWQWWEQMFKEGNSGHLGINHEIYAATKGQWESIYANFQPTGLGATTYLRRGDKLVGGVVDDTWISPLVEANNGQLRTSAGRLGRVPATQHYKYGDNVYI